MRPSIVHRLSLLCLTVLLAGQSVGALAEAGRELVPVNAEHRRLLSEAVPAGTNRILVGHRTPVIMVLGPAVGGRALPEGGAVVIEPRDPPRVLGVLMLAPIPGAGFHGC